MNRMSSKSKRRDNMKKVILAATAASLLWFVGVGSALADYALTLTSGGNITYGGVYVGPYQVSVNGAPYSLICDDYATEINTGYAWGAVANTWTDLQSMKFAPNFGSGAAQAYKEIFYLSAQMELLANSAYIAPIHYALWQIADTNTPTIEGSGSTSMDSSSYWLSLAASNWQTVDTSNFLVYTPDPKNASQEFIMVKDPVPLPPSVLLLATGLLGFVGFRKRPAFRTKG
jgi:hypothetical protein